jgi:hypothetical protein
MGGVRKRSQTRERVDGWKPFAEHGDLTRLEGDVHRIVRYMLTEEPVSTWACGSMAAPWLAGGDSRACGRARTSTTRREAR